MVMSVMREKTKVVLFVALLAFVGLIFFDWGMQRGGRGGPGQSGVIGEVNGREITTDAYRRMRQSIVASFEARAGRAPEYADFDAIEEETWLTLVRETLVQSEIERLGIQVTDPEILQVLRTSPPDFIRANPQFQNEEGQFDPVRYSQALADPSVDWLPVENYIRAILPSEKLQNYVGMNARVTTGEVRDFFLARNEKVKVRYVRSSPALVELPEDAAPESALRAHYEENPDDFMAGEQAVLDVVTIPKLPSAQDTTDAREDLLEVRRQIVAGADFGTLATTWSDDGSAARGGDLGTIRRGDMVPDFESVAFSTPVGEVSDVFSTPFGFHILRVDDIKTENDQEQRQVRHILMRIEASNATLREVNRKTDDFFAELEAGGSYDEAAENGSHEIVRTDPFERGGIVPGIGLLRGVDRFAFGVEPGTVAVNPLEDETNVYILRLVERVPPGRIPFEDVRDRIEDIVKEETRRELARAEMVDAISAGGGTLEEIAEALTTVVDTTGEFSRETFVPGVGRKNAFVATAFTLVSGSLSDIVETDRGYYVMELAERIPADETAFEDQKDTLRQQLIYQKRQTLITAWIEGLLRDAEVIDYRGGNGVLWTPQPELFQFSEA